MVKLKKAVLISSVILGAACVGMNIFAKKVEKSFVHNNDLEQKNPMAGKKVIFVENKNDRRNADGVKGHLEAVGEADGKNDFYNKYIKRGIDMVLSFIGLIVLSPLYLGISLAIKIDDPGPVLFTQKRVGQNKEYFQLHKFRSMKMSAPHDVPTHMLEKPDHYITRVGKFLRKYSLDELPQIWDIFVGNMSIIGPRPALWNQDLLIAERDKYGANDVKPGLTGWAQINGRDELEIPDKARLDGEYIQKQGLIFDTRCFFGTVKSVVEANGILEGGTKEMHKAGRNYTEGKSVEELIGHIGFSKPVHVGITKHKKILVTGIGAYIGESFKAYASEHYRDNFRIDTIDMIDGLWREHDFSSYDIVYHVAGIAHADVGNVSDEIKEKYYAVNTDLAIEVCQKTKKAGVKEFIFMSSMIVYGESAPYGQKKIVNKATIPSPINVYGDSKFQADVAVRELADENFIVIVLRPPMIYGKNCKGNYPTLAKLAKRLPVFPNVNNERSMLYIDNFCEFLCQIMLVECTEKSIVLIPQNGEWTKTAEMVKTIAEVNGKKIRESAIFKPAILVGSKIPGKISGLINKAFGNNCYDQDLSVYEGINYRVVDLKESIEKTEDSFVTKANAASTPLVSLITVSYNSEKTIRSTIESVLNQTYTNIEYRIVDGFSDDSTVTIAHEYDEKFAERGIKYNITSEKDNGIYDAMNKGIMDTTGELVGIINSDDWFETNAIQTVVNSYNRTNFDYYYADIRLIKENGTSIIKHSKADTIVTSRHWNHPTCFVAKKVYEELGAFRCQGIHDDFDFFLRVRQAGKKIVIENKILANFRVGGTSNDKNFEMCKKRCADRYKCYRNNGYSFLYGIECIGIEAVKFIIG